MKERKQREETERRKVNEEGRKVERGGGRGKRGETDVSETGMMK